VLEKEAKVYEQIGRKLSRNPPSYLRRIKVGNPPGAIPIEKLLQQYGKTHLQLVNAEEQIGQFRQIASSLEAQLKAALRKLAEQGEYVKKIEAFLESNRLPGGEDALSAFKKSQEPATNDKPKEGLTPVSEIPLPKTPKAADTAADD
jgi:hypothetical protein